VIHMRLGLLLLFFCVLLGASAQRWYYTDVFFSEAGCNDADATSGHLHQMSEVVTSCTSRDCYLDTRRGWTKRICTAEKLDYVPDATYPGFEVLALLTVGVNVYSNLGTSGDPCAPERFQWRDMYRRDLCYQDGLRDSGGRGSCVGNDFVKYYRNRTSCDEVDWTVSGQCMVSFNRNYPSYFVKSFGCSQTPGSIRVTRVYNGENCQGPISMISHGGGAANGACQASPCSNAAGYSAQVTCETAPPSADPDRFDVDLLNYNPGSQCSGGASFALYAPRDTCIPNFLDSMTPDSSIRFKCSSGDIISESFEELDCSGQLIDSHEYPKGCNGGTFARCADAARLMAVSLGMLMVVLMASVSL